MLDEDIMYGNETTKTRNEKAVMYWGWHLYRDICQLNNRIHEAKKVIGEGALGVLGELDIPILMEQAASMGEIDWQNMPNMDHHYKVVSNPKSA